MGVVCRRRFFLANCTKTDDLFPSFPLVAGANTTVNTVKLVEGQAVELEDGTLAYVQSAPRSEC